MRYNKILTLLFGVGRTNRELAKTAYSDKEIQDDNRDKHLSKRQTTNASESFNRQLKTFVQTDRSSGLPIVIEKLTQFINTQTLKVVLRYHNIDDLKLVRSLTQKQCDKACELLSSEIKVQLNRNIRPSNGKLRSLFDNSLTSMINITQEEGQRLESDAKDIINKGYATFVSGEGKIKKDLVTI
jgi:septum formation topological specificity factor MinE